MWNRESFYMEKLIYRGDILQVKDSEEKKNCKEDNRSRKIL